MGDGMSKIGKKFTYQPIAGLYHGARRHPNLVLLAGLTLIIGILYLPALTAYFISDDFAQVSYLYFNINALLSVQLWKEWFIGVLDGYLYFRPAAYSFMLIDFLMWNQFAPGYHLTRLILHLLSSFLVYYIGWRLSHNRITALTAALLFAVLPVHAEAISWIAATTDALCGLALLTSFLFFVLYRQKGGLRNFIVSWAAFAVALSAKEIGIVLPLCLLVYDVIYHFQWRSIPVHAILRHGPFWLLLALYLGFRISWLGSFGYRGTALEMQDVWNWSIGTWLNSMDPFLEIAGQTGLLILPILSVGLAAWLLSAVRFRQTVLLGLVLIPLTFIPTINSITGTSHRSFYVPSLGVVLVIACVFTWLVSNSNRVLKVTATGGMLVLFLVYSWTLITRNGVYHRAGEIAEAIPSQVKALHPSLPAGARLVFTGVPDRVPEGVLVYITGLIPSMNLAYSSYAFETFKLGHFPIWFDKLDRTYFFQVEHRKVTERADLVQVLRERKECSGTQVPILTWEFTTDMQGWEPWNDLSDFGNREGALAMTAQGQDPYLASPAVDIPSIAVSGVQIEMRVLSNQPGRTGALYWLDSGQPDFTPGYKESFAVQADGAFHTYSVNLIDSGKLLMDTRIMQFRLDPVDAPAQIAIRSVRVLSPCSQISEDRCDCKP
jgi:hypothetical protein